MSKYKKYLKKVKGRVTHQCFACGNIIVGDYYYRETDEDQFLQTLHAKSFCEDCYNKYGDKLLDKDFLRIIFQKKISEDSNYKKLVDF